MKPQAHPHRHPLAGSLIATVLTLALFATPLLASEVATLSVTPSTVSFETSDVYHGLNLVVGGPDGEVHRQTLEDARSVSFDLFDDEGEQRPDGLYSFQLRGRVLNDALDSREAGDEAPKVRETLLDAGFFTVSEGAFVSPEVLEEGDFEKLTLNNQNLDVDGDLIVRDDACLGRDCTTAANFGFYSVRLREQNTRLMFEDTSSMANFPTNDWALIANDNTNGGANYFSIQDCGDTGCAHSDTRPFTVMSGAPESSLFVDGEGKLGLGTSAPEQDVHLVTGDTPALRLEQDGSVGFTEQTWDIAGNEANFFVRDRTNATLPFRIRPGAPTSAIDVAADGNVGIGIERPNARLDVAGDIELTGTVDGRDVAADGQALDAHIAADGQALAAHLAATNPHGIDPQMIGAEEAGTAAALIAAHEAAYHAAPSADDVKAGITHDTAFIGSPATATVQFATPFPAGTTYVLSLTVVTVSDTKTFVANARDVSETGFKIYLDSDISYLHKVDWIARPVTE